jgi:hypothetical protein
MRRLSIRRLIKEGAWNAASLIARRLILASTSQMHKAVKPLRAEFIPCQTVSKREPSESGCDCERLISHPNWQKEAPGKRKYLEVVGLRGNTSQYAQSSWKLDFVCEVGD